MFYLIRREAGAKGQVILGEMKASLFFAETQAIHFGVTEAIKTSSEENRATLAEYINQTIDKKNRPRNYTADDIAKDTDGITTQLGIMQMAGDTFINYADALASLEADQAQESAIGEKIASEQKGAFGAEDRHSFEGYAEDGKGMYKSNFPKGTPKTAKSKVILDYIQNVWSKNPITLKINENGQTRDIVAHFDPTYSEDTRFKSDASKLMGGNRHGTASDQRVTLDLADDYYQIASEAEYNYSKDETGKDTPTHEGVRKWHYFVNDIYFSEFDNDDYRPYRVTINVKEKSDGNFVYSFSAELQEGSSTPQTLHAVVSDDKVTANAQPSSSIIHQNEPVVNTGSEKNVDKRDLADKPVKNAQEGAEKSGKAVESKTDKKSADAKQSASEGASKGASSSTASGPPSPVLGKANGETVKEKETEGGDYSSTADAVPLLSQEKANGETAKKNNPSVSDADSSLYTREPAQNEPAQNEPAQNEPAQNEPAQKEALTDVQRQERAAERAQKLIEWEKETAPTTKELNEAREYVKNFDNLEKNRRLAIIRTIRSAEGKVSKDILKGVANIMAVNPKSDLEFRFADGIGNKGLTTKIGEKTVIVIDSSTDFKNTVKGTIAHELVHYLENRAGYKEFASYVRKHAKPEAVEKHRTRYTEFYRNLFTAELTTEQENISDDIKAKVEERLASKETQKLIESEITASLVGNALQSETFLKRYANRDKKFIAKVGSWLKEQVARLKMTDEAKNAADVATEYSLMVDRLLQLPTVRESDGGTKYAEADDKVKAFSEIAVTTALYDSLDHGDTRQDNLILMSKMPRYITEKLGISGNLYLYRDHAYENMVSKEQAEQDGRPIKRGKKDIHFHNLGIERMTEAILSLDNPIISVEVHSKNNNPTVIMALPVLDDNGSPLRAVLSFYSNQAINGSFEQKPHIVLTITPCQMSESSGARKGWAEFISEAVGDGRILDYDKKRGSVLSVIAQQARLGNITEASLNDSISRFKRFVKEFKEKNKINYDLADTKYDLADGEEKKSKKAGENTAEEKKGTARKSATVVSEYAKRYSREFGLDARASEKIAAELEAIENEESLKRLRLIVWL